MPTLEKCFVIMPFSETVHGNGIVTTKVEWDHIYEKWIKRAVNSFKKTRLHCKRSPALPGNFVRGIIADLSDAYLVIADITGSKPNVFYELGIRHSLRTGTIAITQDIKAVPSDLKNYYTFEYTYSSKSHEYESSYAQFEAELHEKIDAFGKGEILSDSPVSDFLGMRAEVLQRSVEQEKIEMMRLLDECGRAFEENFNVCEFLFESVVKQKEIPLSRFPVIDILAADVLFSKIITSSSKHFTEEINADLRKIVTQHRQLFLMVKQDWETFFTNPSEEGIQRLLGVLDHVVNKQKKAYEKAWPIIVRSLEEAGVVFVVKAGRKKKTFKMPHKP